MTQHGLTQRFVVLSIVLAVLTPLSLIAEERPAARTKVYAGDRDRDGRGDRDLTGIVVSVNPNGDEFLLRSRGRDLLIDARGGVSAYYQGRRYRIRDLERGDRVAVDISSTTSRGARARSVEVLRSVSERGRDNRGRNNGNLENGNRYDRLEGRVVSFDARRDVMIVRADSGRDVAVDTRAIRLNSGSWERSLRVGDRVELGGRFDGRNFLAQTISSGNDQYRGDDRYGRDDDENDDEDDDRW